MDSDSVVKIRGVADFFDNLPQGIVFFDEKGAGLNPAVHSKADQPAGKASFIIDDSAFEKIGGNGFKGFIFFNGKDLGSCFIHEIGFLKVKLPEAYPDGSTHGNKNQDVQQKKPSMFKITVCNPEEFFYIVFM